MNDGPSMSQRTCGASQRTTFGEVLSLYSRVGEPLQVVRLAQQTLLPTEPFHPPELMFLFVCFLNYD